MNVLNPVTPENERLAGTGTDRCGDAGGWAGVGCDSWSLEVCSLNWPLDGLETGIRGRTRFAVDWRWMGGSAKDAGGGKECQGRAASCFTIPLNCRAGWVCALNIKSEIQLVSL